MLFIKKVSAGTSIRRIEKEISNLEAGVDDLLLAGEYVEADLYRRQLERIRRRIDAMAAWIRQSIDRI